MNKKILNTRNTIVLYSTAICNLQCKYCYIDKNPALQKIDSLLEESFFKDPDYYFNFAKEIFQIDQLKKIEIWGGEPTLRLDRTYYTIDKLIDFYPYIFNIMFSTNFVGKHWFTQVKGLLDILEKYQDRQFKIDLQLSIDGPKIINDMGRGLKTTQYFLDNLKILLNKVKEGWIPNNVILNCFFKPTLSAETIPFLQTKKDVYDYYHFFDEINSLIYFYTNNNFTFGPAIPNVAEPIEATKEIGLQFATLCKYCLELENENINNSLFKTYDIIMPFVKKRMSKNIRKINLSCLNIIDGCQTCGAGVFLLGLLPNKKISLCHSGFCDLLEEYKIQCIKNPKNLETALDNSFFNNVPNKKIICDINDLSQQEEIVISFMRKGTTFQTGRLVAEIITLANAGIIDVKYKNESEAVTAANYINLLIPYCLRNCLLVTGTFFIYPTGTLRLLLNGALDYIKQDVDAWKNGQKKMI